jgi:hypothetical protein
MTMLIAGHETTAAVLTWSIFLLAQVHKCFHLHEQRIIFKLHTCEFNNIIQLTVFLYRTPPR